jgi:hypothetical protein
MPEWKAHYRRIGDFYLKDTEDTNENAHLGCPLAVGIYV